MAAEVMSFRLTYRGKPAGTQVMKTEQRGRHTQLEGRAQFQGPLGTSSVVQRSRSHAQRFFSLRYAEETQERNENRSFDVTFDQQAGTVSAVKGPKDRAVVPYLLPYRDPLGLLHELRSLEASALPVAVPMLGKDVHVQFAGEVELETALGTRLARAYVLHPGQSVVYVDVAAPHYLLKMTQRLAEGYLDALLVKVSSEPSLEQFGEGAPRRSRGSDGRKADGRGSDGRGSEGRGERQQKRRPRRRRRR